MTLINTIIHGECRAILPQIAADSISACITDPPYNYEFIGRKWNHAEIKRRCERVKDSKTLVKNIPYGSGLAGGVRNENWYRRNRQNILEYEEWCHEWGAAVFRVLKRGAFVLVFNSTRTVAHVQVALERAGFYARDILVWRRNSGIPKGFNGKEISQQWDGWHSCLRNEWEAICVLQKPLDRNYSITIEEGGVGLMHAVNGAGRFATNIIEGISNRDLEPTDLHCAVKPLELMRRLVDLVVPRGFDHIVLDPFVGTGTTAVAAKELGRSYLGIDIVKEYCDLARGRLHQTEDGRHIPTAAQTLFD